MITYKNNNPVNLDKVCYMEKFTKNPNLSGGIPSIQFHFTESFSQIWTFEAEKERDEVYREAINKNN